MSSEVTGLLEMAFIVMIALKSLRDGVPRAWNSSLAFLALSNCLCVKKDLFSSNVVRNCEALIVL